MSVSCLCSSLFLDLQATILFGVRWPLSNAWHAQNSGVAVVLQQALDAACKSEAELRGERYFNSVIRGYVTLGAVKAAIDACARAFDGGVSVQPEVFDGVVKLCLSNSLADAAFALMGKRPAHPGSVASSSPSGTEPKSDSL